jgi:hypothetical protein
MVWILLNYKCSVANLDLDFNVVCVNISVDRGHSDNKNTPL